MEGIWPWLLAAVVVAVSVLFLSRKQPAKLANPIPGLQPSDPVKGNLGDVGELGTLNDFQQRYHTKFGGIFSFWYGDTQVVSIADPSYMRDINHLDTRPWLLFKFVEEWIGKKSTQFSNGNDHWRRRKAYMDPAFGIRAIEQYEPEILKIFTEECFPRWRELAGKPQDLKELCLGTAIKTISQVAFGDMKANPQFIERFLHCYNVVWDHVYAAVKGQSSPVPETEYQACLGDMRQVCRDIVAARRQSGLFEPFRFIDLLLKENDEELIPCEMISFFVGGFHTTGFTLIWSLYFLAKYPSEQERIWAEIQANIPISQAIITSKDISADRFSALLNFVDETLRMGRMGPFAGRVCETADIKLHDGKVIPKGTPILQALGLILASEGLWKDASEFFPDRFKGQIDPMIFMPFGGSGKRVCPGRTLLYTEVHIFLANLLRSFRVSFPPGFDSRVERIVGIVTNIKSDPPIVLTPR